MLILYVVRHAAIRHIKVIGLRGILGGQRVYLLHHRNDARSLPAGAYDERSLLDVHLLFHPHGAGYLEVGEALHLGAAHQSVVHHVDALAGMKRVGRVLDVLQFPQEPFVYLRQFMNLVHGIALRHGLGDDEDALVRRLAQGGVDIGNLQFLVFHEAVHTLPYHAKPFLDGLLEGAADGHHLAHGLHRRTQLAVHAAELAQVPARNLAHHIVKRGFEEGRSSLGHGVLQFEQAVAQSQLGRHECQRIARGLGSQRGGTAQPGVHLDDAVILGIGVEGVLHVALADDAHVADDADAQGAELVVLGVGQRLRGGDDDALARVDAQRVEVLHVAHRDAVVVTVAHHLVFYLLPPLQALLHQHLR